MTRKGPLGLAGATGEDLWGGIDLADVFGSGAAAFGSLFERLFGPAAAGPQRGQDVHLDRVIGLDEVLTGGNHAVTIRCPGPCLRCAGADPGPAPLRVAARAAAGPASGPWPAATAR